MATCSSLGYPRIGKGRELKLALERYWSGALSAQELLAATAKIRQERWFSQRDAGLDYIASGDFSLYDHVLDTTVNLNAAAADLPFRIENGSFFMHVTHQDTGQRETFQVNVDGDADSLDDLINAINAGIPVPNVTAGVTTDGLVTLTTAAGYEVSFSDDSSGALAALGVNTFFAGEHVNGSGTIDGAIRSGETAARRLLESS